MNRIHLTQAAQQDIREAHAHFLASGGYRLADQWESSLYQSLRQLSQEAHYQIAVRESRLLQRPIRRIVHRRTARSVAYYVFFVLIEQEGASPGEGEVYIVHVRHGARRPMSRPEAQVRRDQLAAEGT